LSGTGARANDSGAGDFNSSSGAMFCGQWHPQRDRNFKPRSRNAAAHRAAADAVLSRTAYSCPRPRLPRIAQRGDCAEDFGPRETSLVEIEMRANSVRVDGAELLQ
jgi:hypothetical protein